MRSMYQSRYGKAALNDKARLERIADTTLALDQLFYDEMCCVFNEAQAADYTSIDELKLLKELKAQAASTSTMLTKLSAYIAMRQGHMPHKSTGNLTEDEEAAAMLRVEQALERMRATAR